MRINFDEQRLENDFQNIAKFLDKTKRNFFLFRDFQSRNIMIKNNKPYFIDFQGGRKGALYYDLASLLYDANVELESEDRDKLSALYYKKIKVKINITESEFFSQYYQFAAIRLMQALGAFGLRGVIEKKPHFKECIPYAIRSLQEITSSHLFKENYPDITLIVNSLNDSQFLKEILKENKIK